MTTKYKKLYLVINVPIIIIFILMFIISFFVRNRGSVLYYIGIFERILLGLWCIFNGLWNAFTDYYSILKIKKDQFKNNKSNLIWLLLFVLGVGCIITAFMGYGYNSVKKPM